MIKLLNCIQRNSSELFTMHFKTSFSIFLPDFKTSYFNNHSATKMTWSIQFQGPPSFVSHATVRHTGTCESGSKEREPGWILSQFWASDLMASPSPRNGGCTHGLQVFLWPHLWDQPPWWDSVCSTEARAKWPVCSRHPHPHLPSMGYHPCSWRVDLAELVCSILSVELTPPLPLCLLLIQT